MKAEEAEVVIGLSMLRDLWQRGSGVSIHRE
jgi:hypothetical protein